MKRTPLRRRAQLRADTVDQSCRPTRYPAAGASFAGATHGGGGGFAGSTTRCSGRGGLIGRTLHAASDRCSSGGPPTGAKLAAGRRLEHLVDEVGVEVLGELPHLSICELED